MSNEDPVAKILSMLPAKVFYLTASGKDLWCRRPYTFVFSTSRDAEKFARKMGTELDLVPIAVSATELLSTEGLRGLREQQISRIFLDPSIDDQTGDVHGQILRLEVPTA